MDQLNDSAESVASNIAEGFRQSTDRSFARYLGIAAGSLEECRMHLLAAHTRGHVTRLRCDELRREATEIGRMLAALIAYLVRSNRRDRFG